MENKLKAWLRKNQLTKNPNDYVAIPLTNGSVNIHDIVDLLIKEGMEIKRETAIDIISRFNRKTTDMVLTGYNVNTGLVYMRPTIKGTFLDKTWDTSRNNVYVAITQGNDLRKAALQTSVEILGEQADLIEILSITDCSTGNTNGSVTRGRNVELKGSYLKVIGDNVACGIVLRNIDTKVEVKLKAVDIVLNEPSRLLIMIPPSIEVGIYELSIVTQFTAANKLLKEPRKVTLDFPVVIS